MDIRRLLEIDTQDLIKILDKSASRKSTHSWVFLPKGQLDGRVVLVAHIDTVWDRGSYGSGIGYSSYSDYGKYGTSKYKKYSKRSIDWEEKPKELFYDSKKKVYWSPDGLGADDRAGVWAALYIFQSLPENEKPIILLTDLEETGGYGAQDAADNFPDILKNGNLFIELDRQGSDDCVFYNGEPAKFQKFIESYGFTTAIGSFSDISFICPEMDTCGVNLSVGYYNEHTKQEYLKFDELIETIRKVKRIIKDNALRSHKWILPDQSIYSKHGLGTGYKGYSKDSWWQTAYGNDGNYSGDPAYEGITTDEEEDYWFMAKEERARQENEKLLEGAIKIE